MRCAVDGNVRRRAGQACCGPRGRSYLPAERLDDVRALGHQRGIVWGKYALLQIDVVLESHPYMAAREPGLRDDQELGAANAECGPVCALRQRMLRA